MEDLLKIVAAECGFMLEKECLEKFNVYYQALVDWNRRINLTSIVEAKEVALKHFVDSLSAAKFISSKAKLVDIGAGAGFPGIPLKLFRDDIELVLIDSLKKRVEFLKEIIRKLDLKKTVAHHMRAEEAGQGVYRETFDVSVSRAVARLNLLSEYCLPLVKKGGVFIAYKTKDEKELNEAAKAIKILGGELEQVYDFNLKELSRELIIIRKISSTPVQFPRSFGKIKKHPL